MQQMNNFAKAHKLTKEVIQAGDNYAATFALCLKHIIQTEKANTMNPVIQEMINNSQERIAALEAFKATKPTGYIVVTGSKISMCLLFSNNFETVGITNIENATRFDRLDMARVKGSRVQNGAGEVGRVVHISIQIEAEISDMRRLINDLQNTAK